MSFIPLKANALQGAGYARFEYFGVIPNDTLLKDILKPAWWVHWAPTLKPMQRIELVTEDCLLDVELRVVRIRDGLVWVNPIRVTEDAAARAHLAQTKADAAEARLVAETADLPDNLKDSYKVGYTAGSGLWYVTLKATKTTIKTGIAGKPAAIAWAIEHAKSAGIAQAA